MRLFLCLVCLVPCALASQDCSADSNDCSVGVAMLQRNTESEKMLAVSDYVVVIDCGSGGSRAHIFYNLTGRIAEFTPEDGDDEDLLKIEPGIADYANDPEGLRTTFGGLMTQVRRWIPDGDLTIIPVKAHATGGMRTLSEEVQADIWSTVKAATNQAGFPEGSFYTIAGEYEGLFGWLTANYIKDTLKSDATYGFLDLGGQSTQISFNPPGMITENALRLDTHFGPTHSMTRLYSHSYMRLGHRALAQRLAEHLYEGGQTASPVDNPCFNPGYSKTFTVNGNSVLHQGTGDYDACTELTRTLLRLDYECLDAPCAAFGVYQPTISSTQAFYAASVYWYTVLELGLTGWNQPWTGSPAQMVEAGRTWCQRSWAEVGGKYTANVCLVTTHMENLLAAYGFSEDTNQITFARKIDGYSTDWPLGVLLYAMLNEQSC